MNVKINMIYDVKKGDMHVRGREKEAAEKAIIETMKNTAKKMLQEGKLKVGETAEYFPNLTESDVRDIEGEILQKV